MKTRLFTIIILIFGFYTSAQQPINYKALIKDDSGNVLANQTVTLQFAILRGAAQNNVYQETHNPTTDANGIIIVNIGEGSTSDDFTVIAWGLDDHFLNVQIDSGDGLVDLGTTQFMAVPYALYAESSGSEVDATGLEALDEGNGTGWRFIGRNPNFYGDIGQNATDLSFSNSASEVYGATGNRSFASGFYTTASGQNATAMGYYTVASGTYATAIGYESEATGFGSLALGSYNVASATGAKAMGYESTASAEGATVFGLRNTADDYYATVVGKYNDSSTGSIMFQVGNGGSDASRTNALNVFQNGAITAPTFDVGEITDPKSLVTKEYVEVNYIGVGSENAPSGLEAIDEGNGIGWRLLGNYGVNGNIGNYATDLSLSLIESGGGATGNYSFATGIDVRASGENSIASGYRTEASGENSIAMGYLSKSTSSRSIAVGDGAIASGYASTAFGSNTTASGLRSTALGQGTIADDSESTVLGRYNDNTFSSNTLFQIGNGYNTNRRNAFTILDNGYTSIGTHNEEPSTDFQIYHDNDGTLNGFKLQNKGVNENWWRFYTLNSNGQLYLYSKAGGNTNAVGSFDDASGAYTALSDRRVKENFKALYFNWEEFMQLQPLTYHYKTDVNKQSHIGLVAQDVELIYPELVNYNETDDIYQLNYSGFGVVAIKAIQELKREVKALSEENKQLKDLLNNQEQNRTEEFQVLLKRVEALEKQSVSISQVEWVKN